MLRNKKQKIMQNLISWEDVDEVVEILYPFSNRKVLKRIKQKLVCSHPAVSKIWTTAGYSPMIGDKTIHASLHLMINGEIKSFKVTSFENTFEEAATFLDSITI